ncbi:hypothetical protein F5Y18DRAFT_94689 [Xylariaceae sp. FL1019]|nr:hypothetical protein F5Y18DRAFT_94689 [Xylariaceae sp. FL1019]
MTNQQPSTSHIVPTISFRKLESTAAKQFASDVIHLSTISDQPTCIIYTHCRVSMTDAKAGVGLAIVLLNGLEGKWPGLTHHAFAICALLKLDAVQLIALYCAHRMAWAISQLWFAQHKDTGKPFKPIRFEIFASSSAAHKRFQELYQNAESDNYGTLPDVFRANLLDPLRLLASPYGYQKKVVLATGYESRTPTVRTSWAPLDNATEGMARAGQLAYLGAETAKRFETVFGVPATPEIFCLSSFLSKGDMRPLRLNIEGERVVRGQVLQNFTSQYTYQTLVGCMTRSKDQLKAIREQIGDHIEEAFREEKDGIPPHIFETDSDDDTNMQEADITIGPDPAL